MSGQRFIRETQDLRRQAVRLSVYVMVVFLLLVLRLWYLQIVKAEDFHAMSENNRLRLVPVAAPRGAILDRNGKVIVDNRASFSVAVLRQEVQDKDLLLAWLSGNLGLDRAELQEKWEKSKGKARFFPLIVASGITQDQMEFLEENRLRIPGVDVEMKPIRDYVAGKIAVHLLGYLAEIGEQELGREDYRGYNPGDFIGKSGIERVWERELHGSDGGRQLEVDSRGRILRTVSESRPVTGNSLMLTIDTDIQRAAEEAFGDKAGAAVALDVRSGEVLAFVSNPAFDPSLFSGKLSKETWNSLLEDKRRPLENKAIRGQYPPGSTFKIVTALAGIEEGLIDEHSSVTCTGSYRFGNRTFKCWEKKGHGTVNLRKALQRSCDVYFYQLGERLGVDKIAQYAQKLGLGSPTGIGLEEEKKGLIPTSEWKLRKHKEKWMRGETLPVAIGQGYVLATPLQLSVMTAAVANGGTVLKPYVVKKVVDQEGRVLKEFVPSAAGQAGLSERALRLVRDGLYAVVNDAGGTGGAARLYEVRVAGKTGTSQVVKLRKGGYIPYEFRDHALFVAFAPYDKPEIAVAVVVEHGEHGGGAAAPVAGKILRAYFEAQGVIRKPVQKKMSSAGGEGTPPLRELPRNPEKDAPGGGDQR